MADPFVGHNKGLDSPFDSAIAVDIGSGDHTLATASRGLWVGGLGNVKVDMVGVGTGIVFTAVPAGTLLPIRVTKIYQSGTTASAMVAGY